MIFVKEHRSQSMWWKRLSTALVVLGTTWLASVPAGAHEIRPAIATMTVEPSGQIELRMTLNLEAYLANIGPDHADTNAAPTAIEYNRLRKLPSDAITLLTVRAGEELSQNLRLLVNGERTVLKLSAQRTPEVGDIGVARISELTFLASMPGSASEAVWSAGDRIGDSVIRLRKAGTDTNIYTEYVPRGQTSKAILLSGLIEQSAWSAVRNYILIGYEHIIPKGLDHILFVVGLFLLSPKFKDLLLQITAFTVAHSLTLALSMLGVISLPASVVEPLIAASIVYVAIENIFARRVSRWRPVIVFTFGLLHGLGFAGVLNEIGLQPAHFLAGLVAFNVGVELGQLTVVALCFAAVGFWFRTKTWYRSGITVPASIVVAAVGAYWFVERIF